MLRFLFGKRPEEAVKVETQRESFDRIVAELNEALLALPVKPKITIDPESGRLHFETPEQFPDEALALPAPSERETSPASTQTSTDDTKVEAKAD